LGSRTRKAGGDNRQMPRGGDGCGGDKRRMRRRAQAADAAEAAGGTGGGCGGWDMRREGQAADAAQATDRRGGGGGRGTSDVRGRYARGGSVRQRASRDAAEARLHGERDGGEAVGVTSDGCGRDAEGSGGCGRDKRLIFRRGQADAAAGSGGRGGARRWGYKRRMRPGSCGDARMRRDRPRIFRRGQARRRGTADAVDTGNAEARQRAEHYAGD